MDDFELARETAHDYYPDATEVDEPTPSMYLLDGIVSEDERSCVNIMHDEASNTFALVVEERPDPALVKSAQLETRRAALIEETELKTAMAFGACDTVDEVTACWAALSSALSQSARLRIAELGGNVDEVTAKLESFFLTHPEC